MAAMYDKHRPHQPTATILDARMMYNAFFLYVILCGFRVPDRLVSQLKAGCQVCVEDKGTKWVGYFKNQANFRGDVGVWLTWDDKSVPATWYPMSKIVWQFKADHVTDENTPPVSKRCVYILNLRPPPFSYHPFTFI